MQEAISVSTLNNQIKSLLEAHYDNLYVKGELSRVTYHTSGHVYFTLKDENSSISCIMFKSYNKNLKFKLEEGMHIICFCNISVYAPKGNYQLNVFDIQTQGEGALAIAFEQLKKRLEEKGYFKEELKKPLPIFPKKIALVTSKTGAALQDMLRIAKKRYPLVTFVIIDTLVQGEQSAISIAKNIKIADKSDVDLIILARGGGSKEDLWSFNEEIVADAIFEAKKPIISAIGHEIDFLISDFVADKRASTPSNAIEIALPDKNELLLTIDNLLENIKDYALANLHKKRASLTHLSELFEQISYKEKIKNKKELLKNLQNNIKEIFSFNIQKKKNELEFLEKSLENFNPKNFDTKGFAQIIKDGKKVDLKDLNKEDEFMLLNSSLKVKAKVLDIKKL